MKIVAAQKSCTWYGDKKHETTVNVMTDPEGTRAQRSQGPGNDADASGSRRHAHSARIDATLTVRTPKIIVICYTPK